MSQKEIQNFFESVGMTFMLFLPYLLAGAVSSLLKFGRKRRGRFDPARFLVGLATNLWLTVVVVCVCKHFGVGEYGTYAAIALSVAKGHEWVGEVIDQRLGVDRHGRAVHR